jgi:predicted N-formylglutamate amidohydrolase
MILEMASMSQALSAQATPGDIAVVSRFASPMNRSAEAPDDSSVASLLEADEPPAVVVENEHGVSPFFLTCDHAGWRIPRRLGSLGLPASELERHIAWDIGAEAVARRLAQLLDSALVVQTYSRLVIDCNRALGVASSIVEISEHTQIPGNRGLSADVVAARVRAVFRPYHDRIGQLLDRRRQAGRPTILIAVHSFTPVFKGVARPWHIGILYNRDRRFADLMLQSCREEPDLCVGDNEPYSVGDLTDYTIPMHGEQRGLPHVEIEIRQDLITETSGQSEWAARLARIMAEGERRLTMSSGAVPA